MDGQLTPEPNETTEQFKVRVNKAIRELKANPPATPSPVQKTIEQVLDSPAPSAQSSQEAPKTSEKANPAPTMNGGQAETQEKAPAHEADKRDLEIREWAKKKGIKGDNEESVLRHLRAMDQEFHRMKFEEKSTVPHGTPNPAPFTAPPPPPPVYPPAYADRQRILEEEARKRGWSVEDFQKVLDLATEVSQIQVANLKRDYDVKLSRQERELKRNSELNELMRDPDFTNTEIQFEIEQVFRENPQALHLEPQPWVYAFQQAKDRIARRYLKKSRGPEDQFTETPYPTNPPKTQSTVPASKADFFGTDKGSAVRKFADADLDEQKKVLDALGARKTY